MSEPLFCARRPFGPGWRHNLTIEQVEAAGLAMHVRDCPEHPHEPAWPGGVLDIPWDAGDTPEG